MRGGMIGLRSLKRTWQWDGFSGAFAEIGSSGVPYTTFRAVPILASNSRRYLFSKNDSPLSPIRGVADSAYQWYGESPTPRITDMRSRRLSASLIREVGDSLHHDTESQLLHFLKENSPYHRLPAPVIRWVTDSPHRWFGESPTPRITDTESRRLRYSKKKLIWCRFSELLTAKPCL
jgi:hypothetical protein